MRKLIMILIPLIFILPTSIGAEEESWGIPTETNYITVQGFATYENIKADIDGYLIQFPDGIHFSGDVTVLGITKYISAKFNDGKIEGHTKLDFWGSYQKVGSYCFGTIETEYLHMKFTANFILRVGS